MGESDIAFLVVLIWLAVVSNRDTAAYFMAMYLIELSYLNSGKREHRPRALTTYVNPPQARCPLDILNLPGWKTVILKMGLTAYHP